MLGTLIDFGPDFSSTTLGYAGAIASDFATPFGLILGVVLGLLAIGFLVRILIRH